MAGVDETTVTVTLKFTTQAFLALRLKEKIGDLPLILSRVSEVCGPGDQKKAHRERLEKGISLGVDGAEEILESYSGRGPEQVELTVQAGAGRKGEILDNVLVAIAPDEEPYKKDVSWSSMVDVRNAQEADAVGAMMRRVFRKSPDNTFIVTIEKLRKEA